MGWPNDDRDGRGWLADPVCGWIDAKRSLAYRSFSCGVVGLTASNGLLRAGHFAGAALP